MRLCMFQAILLCGILEEAVSFSQQQQQQHQQQQSRPTCRSCHRNDVRSTLNMADQKNDGTEVIVNQGIFLTTRRAILSGIGAAFGMVLSASSNRMDPFNPPTAWAAADETETKKGAPKEGVVSPEVVASKLHVVPTFSIVDAKGVPYMVVGEDAKATGYFFTTFDEANRVLQLAIESTEKAQKDLRKELLKAKKMSKNEVEKEVGINPWKQARISTVPLDFAATLATNSLALSLKSYFLLAPAESDIEDALSVDGKLGDLDEGKVPLFYFEDFLNEKGESPLYFRKEELMEAWKNYSNNNSEKSSSLPPVKVTELFGVLNEMVKPGGTDQELKTLVFVPPKESAQKARDCKKTGGANEQYKLGERILVL